MPKILSSKGRQKIIDVDVPNEPAIDLDVCDFDWYHTTNIPINWYNIIVDVDFIDLDPIIEVDEPIS